MVVCVCDRETVKVAGEGCDHVVTEMYGMIALLKQRGQDFQSHRPQCEVFFFFLVRFSHVLHTLHICRIQVENQ